MDTHMGEVRNAYRVLATKLEGERLLDGSEGNRM
jgi:hypothetical protein